MFDLSLSSSIIYDVMNSFLDGSRDKVWRLGFGFGRLGLVSSGLDRAVSWVLSGGGLTGFRNVEGNF